VSAMPAPGPPAAAPRGVNRAALVVGVLVVLPLVLVLFMNLGRDPRTIDSPLVGKVAPDFSLAPVGGGAPVSLSAYRGRTVVLNFWASWCAPCIQEHPVLLQAARRLGPDVVFLGVVYEDEAASIQRFLAQRGSAYPSLLDPDGRTAIAYGVTGVPETYVVDREGRISSKYASALGEDALLALVRKAGASTR
jgi:cytochrome c biogenesis protein CcmG/thiol:disulfide interchange protein DsbE